MKRFPRQKVACHPPLEAHMTIASLQETKQTPEGHFQMVESFRVKCSRPECRCQVKSRKNSACAPTISQVERYGRQTRFESRLRPSFQIQILLDWCSGTEVHQPVAAWQIGF